MKQIYFLTTIFLCLVFLTRPVQAQERDTLVDVGGYKLHFHIIYGKGTPILFEAGGGDDGSVWQPLLGDIHKKLDATLITYDRAGFGKSGIDTSMTGIVREVQKLETGLKLLGFDKKYFLVAHSFGGCYSMVFAARNQRKIKGAVFIDINTPCFMTAQKTKEVQQSFSAQLPSLKKQQPGIYYSLLNYDISNEKMREAAPKVIMPFTVICSDHPPTQGADSVSWKSCQKSFALEQTNRKFTLATGSSHYIYKDNPGLVTKEIITLYQKVCR
jgi:triacylglycerol esterase/lipase EstA (alpha/beta hydrolase family)